MFGDRCLERMMYLLSDLEDVLSCDEHFMMGIQVSLTLDFLMYKIVNLNFVKYFSGMLVFPIYFLSNIYN